MSAKMINNPQYDRTGLMAAIKAQFRINWYGAHGPSHWARVRHHALHLSTKRQGDLLVAELFAHPELELSFIMSPLLAMATPGPKPR
ncbi:MAG: hypothetical protein FJY46_12880 [Betaproteobacteria bacterium]|nr:hypothetical protein [Betaproteobacteria bacterium]